MPSAANGNSPYIDSQLQALFGARVPGSPSTAGNPAPQAGQPQFPAPPAPATGVQGRPAEGGAPAPFTFPAPPRQGPKGQVIDRAPQVGGQVIDRGPQMSGQVIDRGRAGQVIDRGPQQNGQVIDRAPEMAAPPILTSVPTPQQLAMTPPGTPIQSLLGTTTQDETGKATTALSPDGKLQYQQAIMAKRQAFGPLPKLLAGIPGLPPPPVEVGKMAFNPFSGRFI